MTCCCNLGIVSKKMGFNNRRSRSLTKSIILIDELSATRLWSSRGTRQMEKGGLIY